MRRIPRLLAPNPTPIDSVGATIAAERAAHGAAHADVRALLQSIDSQGVVVQGQPLTTDFPGEDCSLDCAHFANAVCAVHPGEVVR